MKKLTHILFIMSALQIQAQQNCSNPVQVTICPSTYLTSQTNAGMINDLPSTCNISGEDLVYRIAATAATQRIYISFNSVTSTMRMSLQSGSCGAVACSYYTVWSGSSNFVWNVSGNTIYYLWIDATSTVTFNIGFGGDTSSTFISIPNTQGNWGFDFSGCAVPLFKASKPCFQVKYNGVFKTDPMTLSPLNVTGSLCIICYLKNTTGVEGTKQFEFYYNPAGYSSFVPNPPTVPGFYNAGTWISTYVPGYWKFVFNDWAGTGKGDFTGTPNSCLRYEFCFDVVPVTNDPILTNIKDSARTDGFGAPFSGTVRSGCCPTNFTNCLGATGPSAAGSGHSAGFGFADPGALLPIVLLQFDATRKKDAVEVNWVTATEVNNDYFTVQKSSDGFEWITAAIIDGAGNSTTPISYHFTDTSPLAETSYYRLKQTDYDGTNSFSSIVAVRTKKEKEIHVFPNPTHGTVIVSNTGDALSDASFRIYNLIGKSEILPVSVENGEYYLDFSGCKKGIYLLEINDQGNKTYSKIILQD